MPAPVEDSAADASTLGASGIEAWVVPGVARPPVSVPVCLPAVVLAVQAAVAGLAGWQPAELDGEQALAAAGVLLTAERALAAARTRSLTDIEGRRLHRLADARSTSGWLRQQGHEVPAGQVMLARRLSGLPLVADELAAGRLSVPVSQRLQGALAAVRPHVDRPDGLIDGQPADEALYGVIVHGVRGLCCQARGGYRSDADPDLVALVQQLLAIFSAAGSQLGRLEAAFVLLAGRLEPALLPGALGELVDSLLPVQLEERQRRGELDRGLSLRAKHDGSGWRLQADLDLATGEAAFTVLAAELRRDPDNPIDTAHADRLRAQDLDPYDLVGQLPDSARPRSRRERMHDALARALGRYLGADLGGEHDKNRVQIAVVVHAGTLDSAPGAPVARGASGARLPVSLVRQWACTSTLTRLTMTLTGKIIETSHAERTLTAHERRILHTQTGGCCQRRGCTRTSSDPTAVLHPHHANPWAETGRTSLTDTVLLCTACHRDIHHAHPITLRDDRRLGPNGWIP